MASALRDCSGGPVLGGWEVLRTTDTEARTGPSQVLPWKQKSDSASAHKTLFGHSQDFQGEGLPAPECNFRGKFLSKLGPWWEDAVSVTGTALRCSSCFVPHLYNVVFLAVSSHHPSRKAEARSSTQAGQGLAVAMLPKAAK